MTEGGKTVTQTRERADRQAQQPDQAHFNTPENQALEFVQQNQGQPLDTSARETIEPKFAHDFANIRVFADGQAPDLANKLDARAFTIGQNIIFGDNEYQPHSRDGQGLLAHELAHTVQNERFGTSNLKSVSHESDAAEGEANAFASRVLMGSTLPLASEPTAMISLSPKNWLPPWMSEE